MSLLRRAAAFVVAATLSFFAPPPAFSANGVFGGSTSAGEAIVITTDAKAKKLRSAVTSWVAPCRNGMYFPSVSALTPVTATVGTMAGPDDLVMGLNAKGRFIGTQMAVWDLGDLTAFVSVDLSGKLRTRRSAGKLKATVSVRDKASGTEVTTCETGSLRWSASRSPGRIYGGKTTQDEPVVARLDRRRTTVTELLMGWHSDRCEPPYYFRLGARYRGLGVRSGHFASTDDESYRMDDGGALAYHYELAGSVARRSVSGSLHVTVTGTDAAGATTLTCDSGQVSWKAATG